MTRRRMVRSFAGFCSDLSINILIYGRKGLPILKKMMYNKYIRSLIPILPDLRAFIFPVKNEIKDIES